MLRNLRDVAVHQRLHCCSLKASVNASASVKNISLRRYHHIQCGRAQLERCNSRFAIGASLRLRRVSALRYSTNALSERHEEGEDVVVEENWKESENGETDDIASNEQEQEGNDKLSEEHPIDEEVSAPDLSEEKIIEAQEMLLNLRRTAHPPRKESRPSSSRSSPSQRPVYRSLERQDGTVPLKPREKKEPSLFPLRTVKASATQLEKEQAKKRRRMMKQEHKILKALDELDEASAADQPTEATAAEQHGEEEQGQKRVNQEQRRAEWMELIEEAKQRKKENEAYRRLKKKAEESGDAEIDFKELVQDAMEPAIANLTRLEKLNSPGQVLRNSQWESTRAMLVDGFTIGQLEEYVKRKESEMGLTGGDEPGTWRAALTSLLDKRSRRSKKIPIEHNHLRKYLSGKFGLAERTMRVAWGLNRENDLGRMEFKLEDLQTLVLLHDVPGRTTSPLKRIADLYDAKIEVRGAKNIIKLTGTMKACNLVHDAIHEYVDQIRQYEFSPRALQLHKIVDRKDTERIAQLEEEFFDMLEQRHSIILNTEGKGNKTTCSIISADQAGYNDASRTVELALSTQSLPPLSSVSAFTTFVPEDENIPLKRIEDLEALNWLESRGNGYLRWVSPIAQEAIPGGRSARRPPQVLHTTEEGGLADTVRKDIFRNVRGKPTKKVRDSKFVREVVDARVGDVVFYRMGEGEVDVGQGKQEETTDLSEELEELDLTREETEAEEGEKSGETLANGKEAITFDQLMEQFQQSAKFLPGTVPADVKRKVLKIWSPINPNEDLHRVSLLPSYKNPDAPVIEVEFNFRPDLHELHIRRAYAILNPQIHHMLLPWTNTDLQYSRSFHYDLFEGQNIPPLKISSSQNYTPTESESESEPQEPTPTDSNSLLPIFSSFASVFHGPASAAATIPATTSITLPSNLSGSTYEYILPSSRHLLSSRLHRYRYRDHELNFQTIRDGPFMPDTTRTLMLTKGRYDDSPVPMVGKVSNEGHENEMLEEQEEQEQQQQQQEEQEQILEEKKTSMKTKGEKNAAVDMFMPFYTAASKLAFEVGASVIRRHGESGGKKMKKMKGMWSEFDPDVE